MQKSLQKSILIQQQLATIDRLRRNDSINTVARESLKAQIRIDSTHILYKNDQIKEKSEELVEMKKEKKKSWFRGFKTGVGGIIATGVALFIGTKI